MNAKSAGALFFWQISVAENMEALLMLGIQLVVPGAAVQW